MSLQVLLTRIKWPSITQSFLLFYFYSQPTSSFTWLSWVMLYPSPPCSSLWPSSSTSGNRLNVMLVRSTCKSDLGGKILLHFPGFCTLKVQRVRGLRRQLAKDITVRLQRWAARAQGWRSNQQSGGIYNVRKKTGSIRDCHRGKDHTYANQDFLVTGPDFT